MTAFHACSGADSRFESDRGNHPSAIVKRLLLSDCPTKLLAVTATLANGGRGWLYNDTNGRLFTTCLSTAVFADN